MPNLRHMRVRELLKRELNEIFRREFPVELGLISVSEVGVSNDLHSATVFVSSIGDEQVQHTCRQWDQGCVVEEGPEKILLDGPYGSLGQGYGPGYAPEVCAHQRHVRSFHSHVRTCPDGNANVSLG